MWGPRLIPCLLLHRGGLVKTVKFKDEVYLGDPFNVIRIFNEKEVDELIFLDIDASVEGKEPDVDYIKEVAGECFMPFCYGGGIKTLKQIDAIFSAGAEKVSINSAMYDDPELLREAARHFGSQSVVASIDVRKGVLGGWSTCSHRAGRKRKPTPVEQAKIAVDLGAGEILLNSVNRDGSMAGFDMDLLKEVCAAVDVPVIACGGAGSLEHFKAAFAAGASAAAAGSFFVFYGKHRAVLITYPEASEIRDICLAARSSAAERGKKETGLK